MTELSPEEIEALRDQIIIDANQAMWDDMMTMNGSTISLHVARSHPDPKAETTFSDDAMSLLDRQIMIWIGTRIYKWRSKAGGMAQKLTVKVDVELE